MAKFRLTDLQELNAFAMQEIGKLEQECDRVQQLIDDAELWRGDMNDEDFEFEVAYEKGKLAYMQNNIDQLAKMSEEFEKEIEEMMASETKAE